MPLYEYVCSNGHVFEVILKISEAYENFSGMEGKLTPQLCPVNGCNLLATKRSFLSKPTIRMGKGDNGSSVTPKKFRGHK